MISKLNKNKRGSVMAVVFVVGFIFLLILFGIGMALGSSVINWVMDLTMPELQSIGMVGTSNVTHAVNTAVGPVNTFIQNMTWLTGVVFVLGTMGIFSLAFAFRFVGDKWLIGLFFALVLILAIATIFLSNIYEDVYSGTDELADILKEHVLLSYLILYSPAIMTLIAFIAGIIMFSGPSGVTA